MLHFTKQNQLDSSVRESENCTVFSSSGASSSCLSQDKSWKVFKHHFKNQNLLILEY